ncbi:hypothetical protein EW093_05580 [Thiospirochaeta perfilievii]|uniref:Uncharacterized protein n=1 Tax=Thiospirochaeta perfilievii TaxID=252967 RepID=A0A5C1QBU1_9SPIO|nr:hypothetical protein [Thiospirochaeta perfilievii]QEN04196.1 hypothetical protein EW093_05580 [Thiospirochaeta perfilievii]
MSEEFSNRTAKLPFLDINEKSFDSIYGNKNPYIAIYLNYIATEVENGKSSKPVLSYLINKKVNENNTDEIKYNYNQYRQVTEQEGIDIAESALKYMTWALEYTPGVRSEDENNKSDYKVYATNSVEVKEWVNGALLNVSNRSNNYFNGEVKIFNRPSVVEENSPLGKIYDKNLITSPYSNSQGNPIAYSAMGIDTPKTFNYKLYKQNLARRWLMEKYIGDVYTLDNYPAFANGTFSTTMATSSYYDSYVDEIDLYREAGITLKKDAGAGKYETTLPSIDATFYEIEPYLPGVRSETKQLYSADQDSLYHPNKSAGVDSLGLLMGSLSMTDIAGDYLNVFNTKIDEELDANYIQKNPTYHVLDINDQLKKPYRFTKVDLERSTILLPDLSMARPGDILVNYTNNEPMIGVIISADFTGLDSNSTVEDYMKNILVVSINSGFRMANVGVWLSEEGVYGGFTKPGEEKKYHLRRMLVKPTTSGDNISYVNDNFEFFDTELIELDVDMEFKRIINSRTGELRESHWIPNTGEILGIDTIKIKGNYGDDELTNLKEDDKDITILPPFDEFYHEYLGEDKKLKAEVGSNIYQNKGDGLKFYAKQHNEKINRTEFVLLATFKLKNSGLVGKDESPYSVEYSEDIFVSSSVGRTKPDFRLYVEGSTLKFKTKNKTYSQFGVRPINSKIRPGDDFLLRFAKQDNLEVQGVSKDKDFLAVYDKKLLWRANLFIDNDTDKKYGIRTPSSKDWNEQNPWNAPTTINEGLNKGLQTDKYYNEFGFKLASTNSSDNSETIWYAQNEWNRIMESNSQAEKFKMNGTWEDLSDLDEGHGGQVVSFPSAVYNNSRWSDGLVADYMVYNFVRTTSPFLYYNNLLKQLAPLQLRESASLIAMSSAIDEYNKDNSEVNKMVIELLKEDYNKNVGIDVERILPAEPNDPAGKLRPGLLDAKDALLWWSRYDKTAPKPGAWDSLHAKGWNVISGVTKYQNSVFAQPTPENKPLLFYKDGTNKVNTVSGFDNYDVNDSDSWYSNQQAGVDCGGLIYMAEAYTNSKYISNQSKEILADIAARYVHDVGPGSSGYSHSSNNLYEIMNESEYTPDLGLKPSNRKRLIPGDIMFYSNPSYHVAMVQEIDIIEGSREINVDNIYLIESTHHSGIMNSFGIAGLWGVGNRNTLDFYHKVVKSDGSPNHKNWIIGRLKIEI